jgi:hypothetical protein
MKTVAPGRWSPPWCCMTSSLLGAAKWLCWVDVTMRKESVSAAMGATWLTAAVLVGALACSWPSRLAGGGSWVLSQWSCRKR